MLESHASHSKDANTSGILSIAREQGAEVPHPDTPPSSPGSYFVSIVIFAYFLPSDEVPKGSIVISVCGTPRWRYGLSFSAPSYKALLPREIGCLLPPSTYVAKIVDSATLSRVALLLCFLCKLPPTRDLKTIRVQEFGRQWHERTPENLMRIRLPRPYDPATIWYESVPRIVWYLV